MDDNTIIQCPYCLEQVHLFVDPGTQGSLIEDCEVCCQPWEVDVERSGGRLSVVVTRAQ